MPSPIDIAGHRYGRLTAIEAVNRDGKRLWRFACDCGTETTTRAAFVRYGSVRSCGCLRRETTAAQRFIDIAGSKVGRLTVLARLPDVNKHRAVQWSCRCDCGASVVMTTGKLGKKNPTLSCGCLRREMARQLGRSSKQENPLSRTPEYKASVKAKRRARPEVAMAERVSRMLAWALAGVGAVKSGATFQRLGYSPADLKQHLERQFLPGMTWGNRARWEIDHITPISSATCEADVLALNQLPNLRPIWALDNNRKKDSRHFLI